MKRISKPLLVAVAAILILSLSACGPSDNEKNAIVRAEEIIECINAKDYQSVVDSMNENMKSQISSDVLKDTSEPLLSSSGSFVKYNSEATQTVSKDGVDYIVATVLCEYENENRTYIITFTTSMEIVAMQMN